MLGAEEEMQFICEYTGFTREKVLELMAYRQDTVSLDTPIGNDDGDSDSTLGDFVPDSVGISPEEAAIRTNIHETIMDCMDSCLTDREPGGSELPIWSGRFQTADPGRSRIDHARHP